jgi:hypothetical protein
MLRLKYQLYLTAAVLIAKAQQLQPLPKQVPQVEFILLQRASVCQQLVGINVAASTVRRTQSHIQYSGGCTAFSAVNVVINSNICSPGICSLVAPCMWCGTVTPYRHRWLGSNAVYRWYAGGCGGTSIGTGAVLNSNNKQLPLLFFFVG